MTGFLKLFRDEPFIGEGKPFDRFHAWIDLRARASYYPRCLFAYGRMVNLDEGELICSQSELAIRWGWTRSRVRKFLCHLERAGLIVITAGDFRGTRLIITHPAVITRS
jgi:hypothetical protein